MADTPAILTADPLDALQRAQQGKSYWQRVWERLRDDKVTLAMVGVLVMPADHGGLRALVHRA